MDWKKYLEEILKDEDKINRTLLDLVRNWSYIHDKEISLPKSISVVNNKVVLYLYIKPYAIFSIDANEIKKRVNVFLYHISVSRVHLISSMY